MGVDVISEMWAVANGRATIIMRPDYEKYVRRAPILRTIAMVEKADEILAIWDGKSKGTLHAIRIAKRKNKPVREILYKVET